MRENFLAKSSKPNIEDAPLAVLKVNLSALQGLILSKKDQNIAENKNFEEEFQNKLIDIAESVKFHCRENNKVSAEELKIFINKKIDFLEKKEREKEEEEEKKENYAAGEEIAEDDNKENKPEQILVTLIPRETIFREINIDKENNTQKLRSPLRKHLTTSISPSLAAAHKEERETIENSIKIVPTQSRVSRILYNNYSVNFEESSRESTEQEESFQEKIRSENRDDTRFTDLTSKPQSQSSFLDSVLSRADQSKQLGA